MAVTTNTTPVTKSRNLTILDSDSGLSCWQCQSTDYLYHLPCHGGDPTCQDCLTEHWAEDPFMASLQCPSCEIDCGFTPPDALPDLLLSINPDYCKKLKLASQFRQTDNLLDHKIAFTKLEANIFLHAAYNIVADRVLNTMRLGDYSDSNDAQKNHIFAEILRQVAEFTSSEKMVTTTQDLRSDLHILVHDLVKNNEEFGFAAKNFIDEDLAPYMAKYDVPHEERWKLAVRVNQCEKLWFKLIDIFVKLITFRHLQRFRGAGKA